MINRVINDSEDTQIIKASEACEVNLISELRQSLTICLPCDGSNDGHK